ncbi:hypothetical protein Tco_0111550 [Tanacetum coccineum]
MEDLKFVDQHNMVTFLEKTEENVEFHQIVDFLSTCSINYALTVSPTIYASYIEQFWNTATSKTVNSVKQIHAIIDGKAVVISEIIMHHGADEAVHKEGGASVERAMTTDASLVAAQNSDNILKTQSMAMSERVLEKRNEPPLPEGHTSRSREGSMEHTFELMDTVLDLEKEKDAQAVEILKLKQRVKKLERKRKSSISHLRKRIYRHVESSDDDLDEEDASKQGKERETVHTATTGVSVVSAPVTIADVAISTTEPRTPPTTATTAFIDEDLTIAQTLIKMKEEKGKEKGVSIKDVEDSPRPIRSITTLQPLPTIDLKDKGVMSLLLDLFIKS